MAGYLECAGFDDKGPRPQGDRQQGDLDSRAEDTRTV